MTQNQRQFRHELKYFINAIDYHILRNRLKAVLHRDPYADQAGNYHVRSLYFDDIFSTSLHEKQAGTLIRNKYRIRIYNNSEQTIKLERKHRVGQFITKDIAFLSKEQHDRIMQKDYTFLKESQNPLFNSFYVCLQHQLYRPIVLVDYNREAYVSSHNYQHIRINFDKGLKSGFNNTDLFNTHLCTASLIQNPKLILEIKYDRYLPPYLQRLLQIGTAQRGSISKYALCRQHNQFNQWEDN